MTNEQSNHPNPQGVDMSSSDETTVNTSHDSSPDLPPPPEQTFESDEMINHESSVSSSTQDPPVDQNNVTETTPMATSQRSIASDESSELEERITSTEIVDSTEENNDEAAVVSIEENSVEESAGETDTPEDSSVDEAVSETDLAKEDGAEEISKAIDTPEEEITEDTVGETDALEEESTEEMSGETDIFEEESPEDSDDETDALEAEISENTVSQIDTLEEESPEDSDDETDALEAEISENTVSQIDTLEEESPEDPVGETDVLEEGAVEETDAFEDDSVEEVEEVEEVVGEADSPEEGLENAVPDTIENTQHSSSEDTVDRLETSESESVSDEVDDTDLLEEERPTGENVPEEEVGADEVDTVMESDDLEKPSAPRATSTPPSMPDVSSSSSPNTMDNQSVSAWGRIQPILTATLVITLSTAVQGADAGITAFTVIQSDIGEAAESSRPTANTDPSIFVKAWAIAQPILVGVSIFILGWLKGSTNWLLARVDAETHTAVNDGSAPTLCDRIQSTSIGARVWDIGETIWGVWAKLLGFLRDRLFPAPLKQWSNQSITTLVIFVVLLIWWLTSAVAPTPVQSLSNSSETTEPIPQTTQPLVTPKKAKSVSRDVALANSLQTEFSEKLAYQYSDDLIQNVTVDRLGDRLTITIGQEWYDLSERQQQRLAKTLLQSTQNAKFQNLTLLNLDSVRIARNPVVGTGIIIFQTVPPVVEEPVIEEPVVEELITEELITEEPVSDDMEEPADLDLTIDDLTVESTEMDDRELSLEEAEESLIVEDQQMSSDATPNQENLASEITPDRMDSDDLIVE